MQFHWGYSFTGDIGVRVNPAALILNPRPAKLPHESSRSPPTLCVPFCLLVHILWPLMVRSLRFQKVNSSTYATRFGPDTLLKRRFGEIFAKRLKDIRAVVFRSRVLSCKVRRREKLSPQNYISHNLQTDNETREPSNVVAAVVLAVVIAIAKTQQQRLVPRQNANASIEQPS